MQKITPTAAASGWSDRLLWLANLLTLSYLLVLGWYNRFAIDDYCFIANADDYGTWGGAVHYYQTASGRILGTFVTNLILYACEWVNRPWPYTVGLIAGYVGIGYAWARHLTQAPPLRALGYALGWFQLSVLCLFEFNTFFWLDASTHYLGNILAFLVGLYALVVGRGALSYIALIPCFLYVGNAIEDSAAMCALGLGIFGLWRLIRAVRAGAFAQIWRDAVFQKTVLAGIFCVAGLLLVLLSPGNASKNALYQAAPVAKSLAGTLIISLQSLAIVFAQAMLRLPYLGIAFFVARGWGASAQIAENDRDPRAWRTVLLVAAAVVGWMWLTTLPTAFAIQGLGPKRSMTPHAFYLVGLVGFAGWYLGQHRPMRFDRGLTTLAATGWITAVGACLWVETPLVRQYAASEDARMEQIAQALSRQQTEPLYLAPLFKPSYSPPVESLRDWMRALATRQSETEQVQRMARRPYSYTPLPFNELGQDSTSEAWFVNQCLCRTMKLPFEVRVQPQ